MNLLSPARRPLSQEPPAREYARGRRGIHRRDFRKSKNASRLQFDFHFDTVRQAVAHGLLAQKL